MSSLKKYPYLFIGPAMVLLILFFILPIVVALGISFTDMDLVGLNDFSQVNFIGIDNYIAIFHDEEFGQVILNTLFYVVVGVPMVVIFSLAIATAINSVSGRIGEAFRGIYYLPAITNTVAVSFVWMFLYNPSYGLINYFLTNAHIIDSNIAWLSDPHYAKFALIILAVWKGIGLNMIILLAGLTSISKDYYEAADIDGANSIQKYFKITLPQLKYSLFFVIVTTTIGWMQFFDEVYMMIDRESANAKSIALFIYEHGFKTMDYGYASAASIVLFVVIISITIIQLKTGKEK